MEVQGVEGVPARGAVLLCVNHPNNLVDSLLVGAAVPRQVRYLATARLFRQPLLARFLARAGVIPIYRREDAGPEGPDRNAGAFAAVRAALAAGHVVAIYPEGTTHTERRVQHIRPGAARIALDLGREDLAVIPVGIGFAARKAFRVPVRVAFGPPLDLRPALATVARDPARAVSDLTAAIQAAMEAQVVNVARADTAAIATLVEELYRDDLVRQLRAERGLPAERVDAFRLSRSIVDAVGHFQARDPDRVARITGRMARYRAHLAACRISDEAVRARLTAPAGGPPTRRTGRAVLGFPVFLYGAAVNAAPYFLTRWLARRLAHRETDYATVRVLASMGAFPVAWGLETWLVWRLAGPGPALLFAATLPLTGLLAHRYWHGLGRLESRLRLAWVAATRSRAATRLLAERHAIIRDLEAAKADYLAATAGPAPPVEAGSPR